MDKTLLARIQDRSARIGIVGQGYVGLPLVVDTRNLMTGLFPRGGGPKRVVKA